MGRSRSALPGWGGGQASLPRVSPVQTWRACHTPGLSSMLLGVEFVWSDGSWVPTPALSAVTGLVVGRRGGVV